MEQKKIDLATQLLKGNECYHFNENAPQGVVHYDFRVDGKNIEVFNADEHDAAFFWAEEMVGLAAALRVSGYLAIRNEQVTFRLY